MNLKELKKVRKSWKSKRSGKWEVDEKSATEFENIWWDMEKIEPLTPVHNPKEKIKLLTNCEMTML